MERHYDALSEAETEGSKGAQLRAMLTSATLPRDLAAKYCQVCAGLAAKETDAVRQWELQQMAEMLTRVPWEPAQTFWEAVRRCG